jgi:citrate lyase subunit beta/citryl-CoA lyase
MQCLPADALRVWPECALTAVTHQWGAYYTKAVQDAMSGNWKPGNTWGGIKEGMIKMAPFNPVVPKDTQDLVNKTAADIGSGKFHPFTGPIKDNEGKERLAAGKVITDADLSKMDYYVEGVQGKLPKEIHGPAHPRMTLPTSYLFVPGDRPDRFAKALAAGAGAVIIDLEDAVPWTPNPPHAHIRTWSQARSTPDANVVVRINDAATPWFDADLELVRTCAIRGVMLPKAERAADVARCTAAMPRDGIVIPIIETARGVLAVDEVAAASGVQRLAFGTLDYAVDVDLSGDERGLLYPACRMALASKVAGIGAPIAGVTPAIGDDAQLESDLRFAPRAASAPLASTGATR